MAKAAVSGAISGAAGAAARALSQGGVLAKIFLSKIIDNHPKSVIFL